MDGYSAIDSHTRYQGGVRIKAKIQQYLIVDEYLTVVSQTGHPTLRFQTNMNFTKLLLYSENSREMNSVYEHFPSDGKGVPQRLNGLNYRKVQPVITMKYFIQLTLGGTPLLIWCQNVLENGNGYKSKVRYSEL